VSADPKHHEGLQAEHSGFAVLDGTHFATEIIGIRRLGELVREKLPEVTVCFAETEDSWAYYGADGKRL
jgi:putative NIF3 family GTP cyclohydrolase 1 type 2